MKNNTLNSLFNQYQSDKGDGIMPKHNYAEFYERYLIDKREEQLLILEIGVCGGKSLSTWYEYFPNAIIIGLDIEDKSKFNNDRIFTFKLDQSSPLELKSFVDECRKKGYEFDIILDDGSHHMRDQQITLSYLFPLLKPSGLYFIEDLHTSLADDKYPLYGKLLDIHMNRSNTTLFYLMESLNSIYLTKEENQYLRDN
ncbi:class I SAM-dependent methyltransferase, partial [Flavobacterium sp.]|uniref:class I SAM-dependent methyltransferase n=1 Tax=Flavobacterium sp. TaxID=239 RepID=UPI0037C0C231